MGKERDFQSKLIYRLKETYPGCIVLKNDASFIKINGRCLNVNGRMELTNNRIKNITLKREMKCLLQLLFLLIMRRKF